MAGFFDKPELPCCVCGEELPELHFAECMDCLKPYHMRMTESDRDMKDCGVTFLDENEDSLVFLCDSCFEAMQAEQPSR